MGRYHYYVYLMVNKDNTVIYTGVTNNLESRVWQHKKKLIRGFTSKYNINKLVYYEEYDYIEDAIFREKQIKGWLRKKKIELVEHENKYWQDLSKGWPD